MTAPIFIALLIVSVLIVDLVIALRTWAHVHGSRVVICPETQKPVAVQVDVAHAVTSAIWDRPDLQVTSCSRWPERQDCDQPCVHQIEVAPADTAPGTIAMRFFTSQRCAICARPIGPPSALAPQPGFMDPATRRVQRWDEVAPQDLADAIARRRPLCSHCTAAESFREGKR